MAARTGVLPTTAVAVLLAAMCQLPTALSHPAEVPVQPRAAVRLAVLLHVAATRHSAVHPRAAVHLAVQRVEQAAIAATVAVVAIAVEVISAAADNKKESLELGLINRLSGIS